MTRQAIETTEEAHLAGPAGARMMLAAGLLPYRAAAASAACSAALLRCCRKSGTGAGESQSGLPDRDERWVRGTARRSFAISASVCSRPWPWIGCASDRGGHRWHGTLEAALRGARGRLCHRPYRTWELMRQRSPRPSVSVIAAPLKPEPMNDMVVGSGSGWACAPSSGAGQRCEGADPRLPGERILGILIDQTRTWKRLRGLHGASGLDTDAAAQMQPGSKLRHVRYDLRLADGRHR